MNIWQCGIEVSPRMGKFCKKDFFACLIHSPILNSLMGGLKKKIFMHFKLAFEPS
jgi:hypothetical protein